MNEGIVKTCTRCGHTWTGILGICPACQHHPAPELRIATPQGLLRVEIEIYSAAGGGPVPIARAAIPISSDHFYRERYAIQEQIEAFFSSLSAKGDGNPPGFWWNHSL